MVIRIFLNSETISSSCSHKLNLFFLFKQIIIETKNYIIILLEEKYQNSKMCISIIINKKSLIIHYNLIKIYLFYI